MKYPIEIKTILDDIKFNYNSADFEEMTIWLDGILQSEVCEK